MGLTDRLQLAGEHRAVTLQAVRYAVTGLIITLAFSICYWAVAELLHVDPMLSLALVFVVFTGISFFVHGEISFKGHGSRDRNHVRMIRFLGVNLIGFALNQLFVWVLVKQLGGETWWPMIPFVLVTPLLTFTLHRRWVFG